jgi:hypothetical protein
MQLAVIIQEGITRQVEPTDRIRDVKREIQNEVRLPRQQLHLVFGVTHLNNESTFQDYSILANASIVLLETALQNDEMVIYGSQAH